MIADNGHNHSNRKNVCDNKDDDSDDHDDNHSVFGDNKDDYN